ncbi:hypothetical protein E2L03_14635 [Shouchella lehensis]|uniref:YheC/YheD family protein n=2 Tax=Bacillaceae TaxID=186817 RepID=A0A4Y7WIV1_9BACI|nr:hypothetical protein E2L03_14635 [Shouchella lehensis]
MYGGEEMMSTTFSVVFRSKIKQKEETILVPSFLKKWFSHNQVQLTYGLASRNLTISYFDERENDSPSIYVHKNVQKELALHKKERYQVRVKQGELTIGPYIGLLLGDQPLNYTAAFMKEHYEERMKLQTQLGVRVAAFSIKWVNLEQAKTKALTYCVETKKWKEEVVPIPKIIYRRHLRQEEFHSFKETIRQKGGTIFNSNRPDKWELHAHFNEDSTLKRVLPKTEKWTKEDQLERWLQEKPKFVLKPILNSQGRGIYMISKLKQGNQYLVYDYAKTDQAIKRKLTKKALIRFFHKRKLRSKDYIIQEWIALKRWESRPFDVRVFLQKETANWQVNGIECRQAQAKQLITNFSKGGRVLPLSDIFGGHTKAMEAEIEQLCIEIADKIESIYRNDHFAELGIDLAFDVKQKRFVLIEVNFRPGYKGLKLFDEDAYYRVAWSPFKYAAKMEGF